MTTEHHAKSEDARDDAGDEDAGNEDETRRIVTRCQPARSDETKKVASFARRRPAPRPLPIRFGDWLVRRDLISRHDLYSALHRAHREHGSCRVGDALVELGVLDRDCIEEEARSFMTFTTFTVSLTPARPRAHADEDQASPLHSALTALTER